MKKNPEHDEEEMLLSTLSNHNKATARPEQGIDEFQRVNVLFAPDDLKTIDAKVHELKTRGYRWVNRSVLVRHAIRGLAQISTDQLAQAPTFLQLKK